MICFRCKRQISRRAFTRLVKIENEIVNLEKPHTACPDLSRSNGKLKRKYKFDRELLKSLKIKMTGQDGKNCFRTAEIVNSGTIKSDLELFEDAFNQSELIDHLIRE